MGVLSKSFRIPSSHFWSSGMTSSCPWSVTVDPTCFDNTQYTLCTVYVPTNHLYVGDVVILPVEDLIDTDLSVEDGVSLLLSAGASIPPVVTEK